MVSIRNIVLACSAAAGLVSAAPTDLTERQASVTGKLNNTREFFVTMVVTGNALLNKYNGFQSTSAISPLLLHQKRAKHLTNIVQSRPTTREPGWPIQYSLIPAHPPI